MNKFLGYIGLIICLGLTACSPQKMGTASENIEQSLTPKKAVLANLSTFDDEICTRFRSWAGKDKLCYPEVKVAIDEQFDNVTISVFINTTEYSMISFNQDMLGRSTFGDPRGNPFCTSYNEDILYTVLRTYHELNLPLPNVGLSIIIKPFSTEVRSDKYGNTLPDKITLENTTQFGITSTEYSKINWDGVGFELGPLSDLIPFREGKISGCAKSSWYGAILL